MSTTGRRWMALTLAGVTLGVALSAGAPLAQGRGGGRGNGQGAAGRSAQGQSATGRSASGQSTGTGSNACPPPGSGQTQSATGSALQSTGQSQSSGQTAPVAGVITGGDSSTGQIAIQSQSGGNSRVIQVTNSTQIITQTQVNASNLKVGDQVVIQNLQSGSISSNGTAGQRSVSQASGFNRTRGANGGYPPPGANRNTGTNVNSRSASSASAGQSSTGNPGAPPTVQGQITSLSPLTIAGNNGGSLTVSVSSNTRIMKVVPLAFSNLKVGDTLMAWGQVNSNGNFVPTGIMINMPR